MGPIRLWRTLVRGVYVSMIGWLESMSGIRFDTVYFMFSQSPLLAALHPGKRGGGAPIGKPLSKQF